jgi:flagellar basal body rod protein FlgG
MADPAHSGRRERDAARTPTRTDDTGVATEGPPAGGRDRSALEKGMNYGIQLAASGALTALYRTDALANNLANINTTGFKPDMVYTRQRDPARVEDGLFDLPSSELLESLGAGAHMAPNAVDHSQGTLTQTGNSLDMAIDGEGFFVLRTLSDGGNSAIGYTRDGRFTLDDRSRLVSVTTGLPVLSRSGQPIVLKGEGPITVDADGTLRQGGDEVARLQIVDVKDRTRLTRVGDGMFTLSRDALNQTTPATGQVRQGMLEGSAVNAVSAMMAVQSASRAVGTNIAMISYQDRMLEQAINTFARIG